MYETNNGLYQEFIIITKHLNNELDIIPVLYGSLGLQVVAGIDFSPQDIDILVPLEFLQNKWVKLQDTMERINYKLVDLHEHAFEKDDIKIGFAFIEDLATFAEIDYKKLQLVKSSGIRYQKLSLEDFLKVYSKSLHDGYRRTKNNNKDLIKLEAINKLLKSKRN